MRCTLRSFRRPQAAGFPVSTFSFEDFQAGHFKPRPAIQHGEALLYRGWMLIPEGYSRLFACVSELGGQPVTDTLSYRQCHHLPEWYPLLREFTAETRVYPETADLAAELTAVGWDGCFLKDYVKSLSTDGGALIRELSTVPGVVAKMRKYRGLIEGGLCARRIEHYDSSSERRYFVWRGTPFADGEEVPQIVRDAASRITSPFFTIDVARRADGVLRIIELGDGQVSDRKHWSSRALIGMLAAKGEQLHGVDAGPAGS